MACGVDVVLERGLSVHLVLCLHQVTTRSMLASFTLSSELSRAQSCLVFEQGVVLQLHEDLGKFPGEHFSPSSSHGVKLEGCVCRGE